MKIQIKTTSFPLTPAISDYVEKRMASVKAFFKDDATTRCDIELGRTTTHHKHGDIFRAEVHIVAKDTNIYACVEKEDMYAAIDAVRDDLLREVKSGKDKKRSLMRRGGAQVKNIIKGIWK